MSIVALKRNSKRYTNKISSNTNFSLNGGYRNQGRVGQTSLSRSITGTKYRGAEPIGHGGCCGQYNKTILNSNCSNGNNPNIIKKSSINTRGKIDSRVKYPTSVYNSSCINTCLGSKETVKDFSVLNKSQSSNITKKINNTARCATYTNPPNTGIWNCNNNCKAASYHIGGKKYIYEPYSKKLNPISSSEYQTTKMISNNCL
jgi:hypothetical protein